mmetsp:Transcript_16391/g.40869  ORF Transcript_16391/g.40869 Transcript_16391/m.40869 type:complete len:90 (+) Transcript_16391:220-489(+)
MQGSVTRHAAPDLKAEAPPWVIGSSPPLRWQHLLWNHHLARLCTPNLEHRTPNNQNNLPPVRPATCHLPACSTGHCTTHQPTNNLTKQH